MAHGSQGTGFYWADDAIKNAENHIFGGVLHVLDVSLSMALISSFSWRKSPQGSSYWRDIYNDLISQGK